MSKSIYEEALKESKDFGSMVGLKLDKVNNALKQAQKQEKLLWLYRQYYNRIPIGTSMYKVELEIEALEEELENE